MTPDGIYLGSALSCFSLWSCHWMYIGQESVSLAHRECGSGCMWSSLWAVPEGQASVTTAISFCCRDNCFILPLRSGRLPNRPEQTMKALRGWLATVAQNHQVFVSLWWSFFVMRNKCSSPSHLCLIYDEDICKLASYGVYSCLKQTQNRMKKR